MVFWLAGDADTRFLPDAPIVAVTVSPSTGQLLLPVTVTVTSLLVFLLSVSVVGDADNKPASHTGVGVDAGDGSVVGVGTSEGRVVGVAIGVAVGVTDVVIVGVGVGMLVMVKLESWTLDEPS